MRHLICLLAGLFLLTAMGSKTIAQTATTQSVDNKSQSAAVSAQEEKSADKISPEHLDLLIKFFDSYKIGGNTTEFLCGKARIVNNSTVIKVTPQEQEDTPNTVNIVITVDISDYHGMSQQLWAVSINKKSKCLNVASIEPLSANGTASDFEAALESLKNTVISLGYSSARSLKSVSSGYKPVHVDSYVRKDGVLVRSYSRSAPSR